MYQSQLAIRNLFDPYAYVYIHFYLCGTLFKNALGNTFGMNIHNTGDFEENGFESHASTEKLFSASKYSDYILILQIFE